MLNPSDREILATITGGPGALQELAFNRGTSAVRLIQQRLRLADDPYAIAVMPVECRLVRDARDRGRRLRGGC